MLFCEQPQSRLLILKHAGLTCKGPCVDIPLRMALFARLIDTVGHSYDSLESKPPDSLCHGEGRTPVLIAVRSAGNIILMNGSGT